MTNALNFLPKCDHVIVIDQGQIVESGTYHELKSGQSKFSNLLREFTGSEINDDNDQSEQAVEQANQSHDEDEHDDLADVYNVDDGTSIIGKGSDESSVMSHSLWIISNDRSFWCDVKGIKQDKVGKESEIMSDQDSWNQREVKNVKDRDMSLNRKNLMMTKTSLKMKLKLN